jgi:hypothetical protein
MTTHTSAAKEHSSHRKKRRHRSKSNFLPFSREIFKRRWFQLLLYGVSLLVGIYIVYKLAPGFLDSGG